MPVSKAQQKAVNKYMAANYDRINLTVPKGKKDTLQEHAQLMGESVNGFINRAIDNQIAQDCDKGPCEVLQGVSGGGVVPLHSEREKGQEAAQNSKEGRQ